MNDFDFMVIGGGSGGVRAARMAAAAGVKTVLIEERHLGGTCVNVGCVPKKLMVYASQFAEDFALSSGFGWNFEAAPAFDWQTLIQNKNTEISRLNQIYSTMLDKAGVTVVDGHASLMDANTAKIGDQHITANKILLAVGGWPFVPKFEGSEYAITSNEFFFMDALPKHALIVGGGYIALEFACILNGLGSAVTLAYRGDMVLRGFDDDVRQFMIQQLRAKGIDLRLNTDVTAIKQAAPNMDQPYQVDLNQSGSNIQADFDQVIYATGRTPLTHGLGLDAAGVQTDKHGAIIVDDLYRTNIPHIYAIGDVIDRVALTPVAIQEGMIISSLVQDQPPSKPIRYDLIPSAVFTQPPIGTIGLNEAEAVKRYGKSDIVIYKTDFKPMKQTLGKGLERAMMKLIVRKSDDLVLGLHVVGADAGEIAQGFAVAMQMGATKADFDATIGIHPTAAEELVTMRQPLDPA